MTTYDVLKSTAVGLACLGLVRPNVPVLAAGPAGVKRADVSPPAKQALIRDVTLTEGGVLRGVVRDAGRVPLPGCLVTVSQGRREVTRAVTDRLGQFAVRGLSGGVYQVGTPGGQGLFRLWSPGTAPPATVARADVVVSPVVVRGQSVVGGIGTAGLIALVGVAAAVTGVVLLAINRHETDDVKAKTDQINSPLKALPTPPRPASP